jgi:hypothetical protein
MPAIRRLLSGLRIHLEDSERVAFRIHEIPLPAGIRHGKFGQCHDSPELLNGFRSSVEIFDLERTHECIRATLRRRCLRRPLQLSTSRPASFDPPVCDGQSFDLIELPPEHLGIETNRSCWIVGLYFEIDVSFVHKNILLIKRRHRNGSRRDGGSFGAEDCRTKGRGEPAILL